VEFLRENPDLIDAIRTQVMETLHGGRPTPSAGAADEEGEA